MQPGISVQALVAHGLNHDVTAQLPVATSQPTPEVLEDDVNPALSHPQAWQGMQPSRLDSNVPPCTIHLTASMCWPGMGASTRRRSCRRRLCTASQSSTATRSAQPASWPILAATPPPCSCPCARSSRSALHKFPVWPRLQLGGGHGRLGGPAEVQG